MADDFNFDNYFETIKLQLSSIFDKYADYLNKQMILVKEYDLSIDYNKNFDIIKDKETFIQLFDIVNNKNAGMKDYINFIDAKNIIINKSFYTNHSNILSHLLDEYKMCMLEDLAVTEYRVLIESIKDKTRKFVAYKEFEMDEILNRIGEFIMDEDALLEIQFLQIWFSYLQYISLESKDKNLSEMIDFLILKIKSILDM
jgi:hypothetical protein